MKARTLVIILVVITVLALVKIFFLSSKPGQAAGPPPGKQQPAVLVDVVEVKSARVESKLTVSGSVLANEEALLKPETNGKIIALEVKEGTEVQKGQLLAKLNDGPLRAQLKKAEVQQALAADKVKRLKQLLEVKGVSQEEYDIAESAANAANADIELIKAQLMETEIRAPFGGVIGLKNISEGNYISTNDIIASIQQLDPVKIDFSVPEKYAGQIKAGDTVRITIEGTRKTYDGKVYAVDPKIDAATRALKVRALCDNKNREIYPGAYAQVTLILRAANSTIIPTMAVIPDLRGQKVFVVHGGKAEPVKIETGSRTDSTVEVIKGLNPGDSIITTGLMSVKAGSPVKLVRTKK
jgi:membrane fusion protein (multidrug efflux system)